MDRSQRLSASRDEVRLLARLRLSEVTPSRRDFAQYVATEKQELAVIARLTRVSGGTVDDAIAQARAYDEADVAALAVAAGPEGLSLADMAAIAAATTAPILRDVLVLDPGQLYAARLHGGDAAVIAAPELDAAAVRELVAVASSLHMAAVIEVLSAADVDAALRLPHAILGLSCTTADGRLDVQRTLDLAKLVPAARTVIALPPVRSPQEAIGLQGVCDAVMVAAAAYADNTPGS